jgi:hypothetical protein
VKCRVGFVTLRFFFVGSSVSSYDERERERERVLKFCRNEGVLVCSSASYVYACVLSEMSSWFRYVTLFFFGSSVSSYDERERDRERVL